MTVIPNCAWCGLLIVNVEATRFGMHTGCYDDVRQRDETEDGHGCER